MPKDIVRPASEETLMYADDVAVVTDSLVALPATVNSWQEGITRNGMKKNIKKTEVMGVGRELEEVVVYGDGERLTEEQNFRYLGIKINDQNQNAIEINKIIEKCNANVNALYPLQKDRNMPTPCKVIVFSTILKPVLLYDAEGWVLTTLESKVQACEMRVLR